MIYNSQVGYIDVIYLHLSIGTVSIDTRRYFNLQIYILKFCSLSFISTSKLCFDKIIIQKNH